MKNIGKTVGLLGLGALIVALNMGGVSGCGSSSGGSGGGSSSVTATQANEMGSAGTTAALQAISVALSGGSSALTTPDVNGGIRTAIKNAITVVSASSCAEGSLPTLGSGASSNTVNGSDFSCSDGTSHGSGSCVASFSEDALASSTELVITLDCTNLVVPVESGSGTACENVSLDGSIGLDVTVSSSASTTTDDITLTSNGLTVSLADGTSCGVNYNFSENISVDGNTGGGTVSADGCLSACGDAFSVSGSDSL